MKKIIVILGPTASGKTSLSIKLAKKFNGEVVSADSRQVYKGMDIGTGKVTKKEMSRLLGNRGSSTSSGQGIPHYLLDVVSPKTRFSVAQYQKLAKKAIEKIHKKGKLPFLIGGTGFYIQAVVDNISLPKVKPDWKLRKKLEKMPVEELFKILKKLDPKRAKTIDRKNPRRLIRAIEIAKRLGSVPYLSQNPQYDVLIIGVKKSQKELKKLIKERLIKRLKSGMVDEVKKLHKSGVSWKRLEEFGLEYRYIALYLQDKIFYKEMIEKIQKESEHYAKRQMTWFKKHPAPVPLPAGKYGASKRIKWVKNFEKARYLLTRFMGIL